MRHFLKFFDLSISFTVEYTLYRINVRIFNVQYQYLYIVQGTFLTQCTRDV